MNSDQALKIIAVLSSSFPNANISAETVEIYEKILLPYPYTEAQQAVFKIIKTAKFFPSIAEITQNIELLSPNQLPAPDMAWSEVMTQVRKEGWCGKPQFSCEAIQEAVNAIGYRNICASEMIGVERKHFMDIYKAIANRHKDKQLNSQVLQMLGLPSGELRLIKG